MKPAAISRTGFLLMAALGGALPGWAQNANPAPGVAPAATTGAAPDAAGTAKPALPRFKLTDGNLQTVATVGAFYNAIRHARSYRGHMILTKTNSAAGKVTGRKLIDWKSTWTSEGDANIAKCLAEARFTATAGDGPDAKTTVEELVQVDDGRTRRRFNPAKQVWSEEEQPQGVPDLSAILTFTMWPLTLVAFDAGDEFTASAPDANGLVTVSSTNGRFAMTVEAASGTLRSWHMDSGKGEITDFRWTDLELNALLPATAFDWTPPADARKVSPDENKREFVF